MRLSPMSCIIMSPVDTKHVALCTKSPHSGRAKKQHPPWDFNNFRERTPENQQRVSPI